MKKKEKPPLKAGDVYPAEVLRDEYGFNAENRPIISIKTDEVPPEFHALIPYVERWAIPCDVTRGDYYDHQNKDDIILFYETVEPHVDAINEWLDSQPDDVEEWSEAAVHFMYLMKSYCDAYFYANP